MRSRARIAQVLTGVLAIGTVVLTVPVQHAGAAVLGDVQSAELFAHNIVTSPVIPRMLMADSFASGTLATGRVPEFRQYLSNTWEVPIGNWSISVGRARPQPGGVQLAIYDTARSNVLVSTTLIRQGISNAGLVVRSNPSGTTYLLARFRNTSGGSAFLDAVVNGVSTNLASASNVGALATATVSVEVSQPGVGDPTSVVIRYNGTVVLSHALSAGNQTTFGSLTRSGMWVSNSTAEFFDDFFIATWPPS